MVKKSKAAGTRLVPRSLKVSDEQWQQWQAAAAAAGVPVSAWLKVLAGREIKRLKSRGEL